MPINEELHKKYEQESAVMQKRVAQMHEQRMTTEDLAKAVREDKKFGSAVRRVRRAAEKKLHHIEQGKDSMGCYGFRVIDENNVVIGGENYELDLATVASWYGVKV